MHEDIAELYPRTHQLEDGATVTCSLMTESDQQALSNFLSRQTRNDLLYLQLDITQPELQKQWFSNIAKGKSVCICVYDSAGLVGYGSVQVSSHDQSGEIRVNISQAYRSRGLGRILTKEIFDVAKRIPVTKVTARMLEDQYGAKSAFQRLGFTQEEVLNAHVTLPSGENKDLLVMSHQVSA